MRFISDGLVVKYGKHITLAEAEAMHFVAKHTQMHVPEVVAAYALDDVTYIVMSRVDGKYLQEFWHDGSEAEKEQVLKALQNGMASLRAITADHVGGFGRTPCRAGEFDWDARDHGRQYGPYVDDAAFHEGLIEALDRSFPSPAPQDPESDAFNRNHQFRQVIRSLKGHKTVLTHGDLNNANIIVRDDLSVVVLDWDTAGFFPEYWEWYKATWLHVDPPSMIRVFEKFVPPYWAEANIMLQLYEKIVN